MGKKRYFCSYCNVYCPNNARARKNHLLGATHNSNKAKHYAQFMGPAEILEDDARKEKCQRFMTHGNCKWGVLCRHSHITIERQIELEQQVEMQKQRENYTRIGTLEDWLLSNGEKLVNKLVQVKEKEKPPAEIPPCLRGVENLPISLNFDLAAQIYPVTQNDTSDWG